MKLVVKISMLLQLVCNVQLASSLLLQFYLQAAVVEKGITAKDYAESRIEVVVGCIMTSVIAFFIIVACAGAIYSVAPTEIKDAADAAKALGAKS